MGLGIPATCNDAKLWKAVNSLGLRERRPSRFYGNERRGWPRARLTGDRAVELLKQEAGEEAQPRTSPRQGGARSAVAAHEGRHNAGAQESGKKQPLRKARDAGSAATTAHPSPIPASQPGAAETSGARRKHPHRVRIHCIFRAEALYLPGRSVWAASFRWRW